MEWSQALSLIAVFGALFYVWYAVKHGKGLGQWLKKHAAEREIHVIESVSINPRVSLTLIEVRGEAFLVTVSPQGVQTTSIQADSIKDSVLIKDPVL